MFFWIVGIVVLVLNQFISSAHRVAQATAGAVQRHPRRVMATVAALLLGTGATAFAVASLAPDVSELPVRQVLEAVQVNTGADTAPVAPLILYRTDNTRSNDTAEALLRRLGVVDAQAAAFIKSDASARAALLSRPGRSVTVETDAHNRLLKLQARWSQDESPDFQRLSIEKSGSGFSARSETAPLVAGTRLAGGVIRSSLFAATDDARIPDAIALQVASMFSGDIDFARALRKGDRFSVVYETLQADGEPLRAGRVLSAEFVNGSKTFQTVWFQEPNQKGQYYTLEGASQRKAFLASPLEFTRISSGYGMRVHPIARDWRSHKGVDYAAPNGTPVRSVGDGIVEFAGMQRGYGNVVEIKHRDGKSTLFAHLSRINVRKGQKVEQSQMVGAVGRTGWATGPHLHFEFRVNGVHHDPMTLAAQSDAVPLSAASRPAFNRLVAGIRLQLAAASSMSLATAQ